MTTPRDAILPALDIIRGFLDTGMGMRRFDVLMRVVSWSGERPGAGTKTTTDTPLFVFGNKRIKVQRVSARDIIASGGLYLESDFKIGPLTPSYAGTPGGVASNYFTPATNGPQEVFFRLTGSGFENGTWFRKVDTEVWRNFGFYFIIRAANVANP